MKYLFILLSIAVITVAIEIIIDKSIWKYKGNDKPWTTVGRAIVLLIGCYLVPGIWWINGLTLIAFYFFMFDFALNISNWRKRETLYYRPLFDILKEYYKTIPHLGDHIVLARKYYQVPEVLNNHIHKLKFKQEIWFRYMNFTSRLFYHGDENTKSWYDLAFQRIPPIAELLFKFIAVYTVIAKFWM